MTHLEGWWLEENDNIDVRLSLNVEINDIYHSVPTLLFRSCFQATRSCHLRVSQNYPWSYQSWGWRDMPTVWIWGLYIPIPVVHPDMPVWPGILVFHAGDSGILALFLLGYPWRKGVTQARLSQEVFLALIKSWFATIQYCCLLRSSSKLRGTHRIPQSRSRFWLMGLGIRIHHYKTWSSTKNSTWVFQQFISIQNISLYYKTFSNYKIINFQSTPVLPFWTKPIQWNIHPYHPLHQRHHHGLQTSKPLHPRSAFLSPQKSREEKVTSLIPTLPVRPSHWLDPMDWLMLVAFENRKVFQNRIQDLVGYNIFFWSWVEF